MSNLGLINFNDGVFIKLSKKRIKILRRVEPYITYGYPSRSMIRELIYKRGCGKVKGVQIILDEASIFDTTFLLKHGIVNIEDLINEIAIGGLHFKEVNDFLLPFKL